MKYWIVLMLFASVIVQVFNKETSKDTQENNKEYEELMKRPWSEENYNFAVKLTKESVAKKFEEVLLPKELKDKKLAAKLTKEEKEKLQRQYEKSFAFEKKEMEKHLEATMKENKDMIGRLPIEAIKKSVQELVDGMEKPIEEQSSTTNKQEL